MIIALMKTMKHDFNTTFIFSTHDTRIIGAVEIIYTLEDGQLTVQREERTKAHEESLQNRVAQLRRYSRRSLLTVSLIAFGVIFVLVFVAVTGSFKQLIITQITESYLSDMQVHRRGYVAAPSTACRST